MTESETSTHLTLMGFHVEPHEVNCPDYHTIELKHRLQRKSFPRPGPSFANSQASLWYHVHSLDAQGLTYIVVMIRARYEILLSSDSIVIEPLLSLNNVTDRCL